MNGQVVANKLIRLRGGAADGRLVELSHAAAYPNSVVVDRVPGALNVGKSDQGRDYVQVPIGRDLVYLIGPDNDAHGVRFYDVRVGFMAAALHRTKQPDGDGGDDGEA